jgi:hypothetical protein
MSGNQLNLNGTFQNKNDIVEAAYGIADGACTDINNVLTDIQNDSTLGNTTGANSGREVLTDYGYTNVPTTGINISQASGAMIIDDLMQKISTKVQVAAQLLAAQNNNDKMVFRSLFQ